MTTRNALLITLVLGATHVGCGSPASDFCDVFCDCENCSEKRYDECIIGAEAGFETADVYGCRQEADDLDDCNIRKYRCNNNEFTVAEPDCRNQNDELSRCVKSASAIQ